MASAVFSCRWDWCRSSFPSIDVLHAHLKHEHIWPMKPMRKEDIVLMRRMDLQSLHSTPNTDSSIVSRGLPAGWSRNSKASSLAAPLASSPEADQRPENEIFVTFTQTSSPPQTHLPQSLPASPSFESLMKQDGPSGLSAAVEMFERNHTLRADQRTCSPSHRRSPTDHPLSQSSGSSQGAVEQQLTQDDVCSQPLPLSDLQADNESTDAELVWPTDDELAIEGLPNLEQSPPEQECHLEGFLTSVRSQNFRYGSLNVPLGVDSYGASPSASSQLPLADSQESQNQSLVLQTQAPYSSQAMGWSQTQ